MIYHTLSNILVSGSLILTLSSAAAFLYLSISISIKYIDRNGDGDELAETICFLSWTIFAPVSYACLMFLCSCFVATFTVLLGWMEFHFKIHEAWDEFRANLRCIQCYLDGMILEQSIARL